MKTAWQLFGLVAVIAVLAAIGLLEDIGTIALFIGLWLCPLMLSVLNIAVFWRVARAARMPFGFVAGTFVAIVTLSAAVIGLLYNQALLCWGVAAIAVSVYGIMLLRTSRLGRLAAGFRHSRDLWSGFPSFPATPNAKFATMPMAEFIGGMALIALVATTPLSKLHGLWIYMPAVLCLSVGLTLQLCHLRARYVLEREHADSPA